MPNTPYLKRYAQLEKNEHTAKKKKPTHKLHIWFFADTKANAKKPKEQFLANARPKITAKNVTLQEKY